MNNFEKQLEKWNHGILRGAQARLAKCLRVSTATVALWATGKRHPSKGYIAKMSQLFALDEYSVTRLFSAPAKSVTAAYANSYYFPHTALSLREGSGAELSYMVPGALTAPQRLCKRNTALPVFTQFPVTYPHFLPSEITQWWYIPQWDVQQANFLFLLPTPQDPLRILFVQFHPQWQKNCYMLSKKGTAYQLVYVRARGKCLLLENNRGKTIPSQGVEPIGIVLKQVVNLN